MNNLSCLCAFRNDSTTKLRKENRSSDKYSVCFIFGGVILTFLLHGRFNKRIWFVCLLALANESDQKSITPPWDTQPTNFARSTFCTNMMMFFKPCEQRLIHNRKDKHKFYTAWKWRVTRKKIYEAKKIQQTCSFRILSIVNCEK